MPGWCTLRMSATKRNSKLKGLISVPVLAISLALVSSLPLAAQSTDASQMTAEEMETLFQNQKTRGLVIAPSNADSDETPQEEAKVEETPDATTYVELAPDEQVNIQISFDFDSAALRSDQKPKLATLCTVIQNMNGGVFRIVGHTDASGSADYNERLSLLRAQEVKRFLVSDCGIEQTRLEAVGVGEAYPLDKNDPRGDVNRRVEFQAMS